MKGLPRKKELTCLLNGLNQEIHRLRREAGLDITMFVYKARLTEQERAMVYDANEEAMSCNTLHKMAVALGKRLEIRFVDRPPRERPLSLEKQLKLVDSTLRLALEMKKRIERKQQRRRS